MSRGTLGIVLASLLGLVLGLVVLLPLLRLAPPDEVLGDGWDDYGTAAEPPADFCEEVLDGLDPALDVRVVGETRHVEEYASQVTCSLRGSREFTGMVTLRRFSHVDLLDADLAGDHIATVCDAMESLTGGGSRFEGGADSCSSEERDAQGRVSGELQEATRTADDVLRLVLTSGPGYAAELPLQASGIQGATGSLD